MTHVMPGYTSDTAGNWYPLVPYPTTPDGRIGCIGPCFCTGRCKMTAEEWAEREKERTGFFGKPRIRVKAGRRVVP
jgi:hypothetical protein